MFVTRLSDQLEMECFVSKSRIFRGAVVSASVSASILAMGTAGPALASTSRAASAGPASSVLPAGALTDASALRGLAGNLIAMPFAAGVADRAAGTTGLSSKAPGSAVNSPAGGDLGPAAVPGLSPATGSQPAPAGIMPALGDLGSITSVLGLNSLPALG